jgi:hypothetical protein
MKTIETTITVFPDGRIETPSRPDLAPGEHRAVLVIADTHLAVPSSERERLRAALRAAGKLAELTPGEKAIAAQASITLDEARAILDREGGIPLSTLVLELRGPKVV